MNGSVVLQYSSAALVLQMFCQFCMYIHDIVGSPGLVQSIQASVLSISSGDCVILLHWDRPANVTTSFISNYTIDFETGTIVLTPSTNAILHVGKCNLNATVGIRAVDMCGRPGARAEVVLKDVMQDIDDVTNRWIQTTVASGPDPGTCRLYSVNGYILILFSVCNFAFKSGYQKHNKDALLHVHYDCPPFEQPV